MRSDWIDWVDEPDQGEDELSYQAAHSLLGCDVTYGYSVAGTGLADRLQRRDLLNRLAHSESSTDRALYRMIN